MNDEKEPIVASEQNRIEVELSKAFHLLRADYFEIVFAFNRVLNNLR